MRWLDGRRRISGKALLRPTEFFYYFENYFQDKYNELKTKLELILWRKICGVKI